MTKAGYACEMESTVAVTANTLEYMLGVKSGASFGLDLTVVNFGFDATAPAGPVLVELCYCTWATNSPGTNSTSVTPVQTYGRSIAHGVTAARDWSAAPTTATRLKAWFIPIVSGSLDREFPLGMGYDCAVSEGFVLRVTTPASSVTNIRAGMGWERC